MTENIKNEEIIENSNIDNIHPGIVVEPDVTKPKNVNILVPENYFESNEIEDTTETIAFIPTPQTYIERNQEKYDLYEKILNMLSITKPSHFMIYTNEKVPYKQDYLYKKVSGVRVIKGVDIPSHYEHFGLFSDGHTEASVSKIKTYETVHVEICIANQDGGDIKWVKIDSLRNIMVKSIEYFTIN